MKEVVIKDSAFVTVITSCVEVYRKESYGIILGHKQGNDIIVKTCLPFQTAYRGYTTAEMTFKKEKIMNDVLGCMSPDQIIGDFHSHPGRVYDYLSKDDKKDMTRHGRDWVSLLVSIKKASQYQEWKHTKDNAITGTVGKYYIKIKAFGYEEKKEKVRQIPVFCTYLEKINKKYCDINKFKLK